MHTKNQVRRIRNRTPHRTANQLPIQRTHTNQTIHISNRLHNNSQVNHQRLTRHPSQLTNNIMSMIRRRRVITKSTHLIQRLISHRSPTHTPQLINNSPYTSTQQQQAHRTRSLTLTRKLTISNHNRRRLNQQRMTSRTTTSRPPNNSRNHQVLHRTRSLSLNLITSTTIIRTTLRSRPQKSPVQHSHMPLTRRRQTTTKRQRLSRISHVTITIRINRRTTQREHHHQRHQTPTRSLTINTITSPTNMRINHTSRQNTHKLSHTRVTRTRQNTTNNTTISLRLSLPHNTHATHRHKSHNHQNHSQRIHHPRHQQRTIQIMSTRNTVNKNTTQSIAQVLRTITNHQITLTSHHQSPNRQINQRMLIRSHPTTIMSSHLRQRHQNQQTLIRTLRITPNRRNTTLNHDTNRR